MLCTTKSYVPSAGTTPWLDCALCSIRLADQYPGGKRNLTSCAGMINSSLSPITIITAPKILLSLSVMLVLGVLFHPCCHTEWCQLHPYGQIPLPPKSLAQASHKQLATLSYWCYLLNRALRDLMAFFVEVTCSFFVIPFAAICIRH
jgi:hypothetical protein